MAIPPEQTNKKIKQQRFLPRRPSPKRVATSACTLKPGIPFCAVFYRYYTHTHTQKDKPKNKQNILPSRAHVTWLRKRCFGIDLPKLRRSTGSPASRHFHGRRKGRKIYMHPNSGNGTETNACQKKREPLLTRRDKVKIVLAKVCCVLLRFLL